MTDNEEYFSSTDFLKFRQNNYKHFLKTIKKEIKNHDDYKSIDSFIECLKNIKEDIKKSKKQYDLTKKDELNTFLDDNLQNAYNKPWARLNEVHKIKKLIEYVEKFDIKKKKSQKIIDNLTECIKDKSLKNKDVKYKKGRIKKISNTEYDKYFKKSNRK